MAEKKIVPAERLSELRQMFDRGDRLQDIASAFGVTPSTLRTTLSELGLARPALDRVSRRRTALSRGEVEAMLRAYEDPARPVSAILADLEIPISRLYAELQKAGLPRRKHMPSKTASLSSDERNNIATSYKTGISAKEIATREGLNYDQVYVVLREDSVILRADSGTTQRSTTELNQRLRSLYADETISVASIITELNITQHRFKQIVKDLKLQARGKGGGARSISTAAIAKMPEYARRHEAGESISKLAAEAGIGLATMKARLKKLR